jgi:hypothetical protein
VPGVSAEQVAQAREVDLLTYLQEKEPWELKRSGPGEYRTASHGSLVISNNLWFWYRGQVGGRGALDYLIKIRGMGFVEAVEKLNGICPSPAFLSLPVKRPEARREDKPLCLPVRTRLPSRMLAYLQGRGIDPDVIRWCMNTDILYEGRYHGETVCVFVGRDEDGKARFGSMRATDSDLKRDCVGSDKSCGFKLAPKAPTSAVLAVFEAPIDAISHLCLHPAQNAHRLSLGGTSDKALMAFLEKNSPITDIFLCLDADAAGQEAALRIEAALAADERFEHIRVAITPPQVGKDYSDTLQQVVTQRQEQRHVDRHSKTGHFL